MAIHGLRVASLVGALSILVLHTFAAGGQSVVDGLRGSIKVNTQLRVALIRDSARKEAFMYSIREDTSWRILPAGMVFAGANQRGTMIVWLRFLNPVLYSWKTEVSGAPTPSFLAAEKFVTSLGDVATAVAPKGALGTPTAVGVPKKASGAAISPAVMKNKNDASRSGSKQAVTPPESVLTIPALAAPDLTEWALLVAVEPSLSCLNSYSDESKRLLAAVAAADSSFYRAEGRNDDSSGAGLFIKLGSEARDSLVKPETQARFVVALGTVDAKRTAMATLNTKADAAQRSTGEALAALEAVWKKPDLGCAKAVSRYTHQAISRFMTSTGELLKARRATVAKLDTLVTALRDQQNGPNEDNVVRLSEVHLPSDSVSTVKLSITSRKLANDRFEPVADKTMSVDFRIRTQQSFTAEVAAGLAFLSNVTYPRYTVGQVAGASVVQKNDDVQRTSVTLMLNLLSTWDMGPMCPGLQLGVGSATAYPLLLVGVVGRFHQPAFSVSLGAAFPWYRELKTLSVGAPVANSATLDADLSNHIGTPSLYIGVQKTF